MSTGPCKDCEEHNQHVKSLAMLCSDVNNLKEKDRDHRETIQGIWNALDKKCNTKTFVLLLSCLITIFLFLFGSQITLHQDLSDVSVKVEMIQKIIEKK